MQSTHLKTYCIFSHFPVNNDIYFLISMNSLTLITQQYYTYFIFFILDNSHGCCVNFH